MAVNYTISKTDGSTLAVVPQATIVAKAGLNLIGKNYVAFGEALNENLVSLAESFASVTAPASPMTGQCWYDKATSTLKVYDGTKFKGLQHSWYQAAQPSNAVNNDIWFDTSENKLYVYNDNEFVLVGPNQNELANVFADSIDDTSGTPHNVLRVQINGTNVAIITNEEFTPAASQNGFASGDTLKPGINLGTDNGSILNGVAVLAAALDDGTSTGLLANKVVRTDRDAGIDGSITAFDGFYANSSQSMSLLSDINNNLVLANLETNKDFSLKLNASGGQYTILTAKGASQRLGILTANPQSTLDVVGTITADSLVVRPTGSLTIGTTPSSTDNSNQVPNTIWVRNLLNSGYAFGGQPSAPNNTILPRYFSLLPGQEDKLATVWWVRNQFNDTQLTGVPTTTDILDLTTNTSQVANAKFVRAVVNSAISGSATGSDVLALAGRVGTLESQILLKANIASQSHTGNHDFSGTLSVQAPSSDSHAATKKYVDDKFLGVPATDLSGYARTDSPAFTGTPTAPTPSTSDNSTRVATTQWVRAQGFGSGSGSGTITGVTAGTGLTGGGASGAVTLGLSNTGVTAGTYTNANVTVNAQGRITSISNGTGGSSQTVTISTSNPTGGNDGDIWYKV